MIDQHDGVEWKREECVNNTNIGEYYTKFSLGAMMKINCKWFKSGDLEISTKPKGKAWIGVDDVKQNTIMNPHTKQGAPTAILEDMTSHYWN